MDVRTDVYGIGATLYEALTGRPPFVANSAAEILHQVLYAEAIPPQKIAPNVPRDLQSICLQCLEKLPDKRYASAAMLLDDIERFLSGKPTKAKPVSRLEKSARWIRRNPVQFFSSAGLLLSLLVSLVVATWYFARVTNLEAEGAPTPSSSLEAKSKERLSNYFLLVSAIQNRIAELPSGWTWQNEIDLRTAVNIVPSEAEKARLRELAIRTFDGFDLRKNTTLATNVDPYGLAWSPDGQRLVIGENVTRTLPNQDEAYVLYTFGQWPQRPLKEILLPAIEPEKIAAGLVEGIRSLLFLPDNRSLLIGCRSGWIQIYDFELEKITAQWKAHDNWCYCIAFDPSRNWISSGSRDGTISIWDASTHQLIRSLKATGPVKCLQVAEDHLVALGSEFDVFSLVDFQKVDTSQMVANSDSSIMYFSKDRESFVLLHNLESLSRTRSSA